MAVQKESFAQAFLAASGKAEFATVWVLHCLYLRAPLASLDQQGPKHLQKPAHLNASTHAPFCSLALYAGDCVPCFHLCHKANCRGKTAWHLQ